MAKRTSNRSQANDSGTPQAQPKARRSRGTPAPQPDTLTSFPDVERTENDENALTAAFANGQSASAMSGQANEQAAPRQKMSSSMGSEPSDEDIRMRAYQRYLERGGGHGMDFEDWLAAERELKHSK